MARRGIKALKELVDDLVEEKKREVRSKYLSEKEREAKEINKMLANGIKVWVGCTYMSIEIKYELLKDIDEVIEVLKKMKDKIEKICEIHNKKMNSIKKLENWRTEAYKAIIENRELPDFPEV